MPEISATKYTVHAGWDDVPHLSEKAKREQLASIPPYQREARSKGIPTVGAGLIYPVPEDQIAIDPFEIPAHWPRFFGMDVGWNRTACVWGAIDKNAAACYLYAEHYRGEAEPSVHAEAIKARGVWIPGAIDPSSRNRSQLDGRRLLALYRGLGLNLTEADNDVETGLATIWELLSTGRLKVFSTMQNWFAEYRLYRRDKKGKIVKAFDHLMDGTRYGIMTGRHIAKIGPGLVGKNFFAGDGVMDSNIGF